MKENKRSAAVFYRKYGIALILIILFVASALVNHNFLKPRNLINILTHISVVTIIACGEEMLIVSGLIRDLSAGPTPYRFHVLCGRCAGKYRFRVACCFDRTWIRCAVRLDQRLSCYPL